MTSLPSNTFVFNFNAKDYNTSTRTIPRTSGQTLAQDMVFRKTIYEPYSSVTSAITKYDDHIHFSGGTYAQFSFSSSASSPFNITTANPNMTFVVKMWRDPDAASITPGTTVAQSEVLANRGNNPNTFNWLARISPTNAYFHTKTTNAAVPSGVTWSSNPVIIVYRIKNRQVEVINITEGTKNTPFTPSYNGGTNRVTFFGQGYQSDATDVRNCIGGDFYWAYLSRESLTDEQVQQVIAYNDSTGTFETDVTAITASYNSSTCAVTLTTDENTKWTASTTNNWISISPSQGTGSSVFIVTVAKNTAYAARNGLVTATNGENTIEITVAQDRHPFLVPKNNIYRGGILIN